MTGATPPAPLAETGALALPAAVETSAWAVPAGDALRVLVNRPGAGATDQLRVNRRRRIEPLAPLPLVVAGAAACADGGLLVTGSDPSGRALALGVSGDGSAAWRLALPGPRPWRWPVPGCAPRPAIAWQTEPEALEVAEVGPEGLARRRSLAVGGPPLGTGGAWAAWTGPSGVRVARLGEGGAAAYHLAAEFPFDVAIGAADEGAAVAWTVSGGAFLARIGGAEPGPPTAVELGPAAGGTIAVVPGPEPLVWAQRQTSLEDQEPRWISALAVPGRDPVLVEELVFAVAWWEGTLAVVCAGVIRFFEPGTKVAEFGLRP